MMQLTSTPPRKDGVYIRFTEQVYYFSLYENGEWYAGHGAQFGIDILLKHPEAETWKQCAQEEGITLAGMGTILCSATWCKIPGGEPALFDIEEN